MPAAPPVVLTIAGFDPSSGAGVTADIKTIAAHGCYGTACITSLTVQSTAGVLRVQPISKDIVRETLRELASDMPAAAIRIGMLGSAEVVDAVAEFLDSSKAPNVVLDPVLKASSGAALLDEEGLERLVKVLLPLSLVITPNIDEAAALTGLPVRNLDEMKTAARKLHQMGAQNVVVTGGHLERAADVLSVALPEGKFEQFEFVSDRARSNATHGTGCAFATALAANLAQGRQLQYAIVLAKAYVTKAISRAFPLGKGAGPLHHLYRMDETPRPPADLTAPMHRNSRGPGE
ncbi:MAG TPA: bifunctional hydroxymethylpyrimidine kinase/phosphomethylpyrimidine kinase [Terriglobales bacterium]|nr:bifunctional hydroxymethylpyrimidine kinase/phosphomethylpyrimidine kinase [Terriglobales bacterium]